MRSIAHYLPAWLLTLLPVRLARRYASSRIVAPATPHLGSPQLLVDVSVVYRSDARTGIQRVVRALLLQLLASPPLGYAVRPVFATAKQGYCYADPNFLSPLSIASTIAGCKVVVKHGDQFVGLDLAAHLLPRHQSQVLGWKRNGVKIHMVVYDLLPLQYPAWFNAKTTRNFQRWIKCVAVYADSAICISETAKTELSAWIVAKFNMPPTALPTSTITLGADISASAPSVGIPPSAEFLLARMRNTPSVMIVGTLEPRKGHDQALAAFELLWEQHRDAPLLVIVGRPGWKTDALQQSLRVHPQLSKKLFWLTDTSDEFLTHLYVACSGVLVASRAEGFGLPLIEAALHSKPILARDIAVFRETTVAGVEYFKGDTPQALATSIQGWLANGSTFSRSRSNQYPPTWEIAAAQLLHALGLTQLRESEVVVDQVILNSNAGGAAP
jgi:glycosyltransferase involved in cell wall biosynthesis